MRTAVMQYLERKLFSNIVVLEDAGKVSKMTKALDVHRFSAPRKNRKGFCVGSNVSMIFTSYGKSVLLLKSLILKETEKDLLGMYELSMVVGSSGPGKASQENYGPTTLGSPLTEKSSVFTTRLGNIVVYLRQKLQDLFRYQRNTATNQAFAT
ncbi:hypothetical protein TNCV_2009081 [Trichonephila clavipes]|nr:hypothetical protein TNCV_2009081 [Trichonephila clavipes]